MKLWPSTSTEFHRVVLEALIGANIILHVPSAFPEPSAPLPELLSPTYMAGQSRYRGLDAIEDIENGTVKFVRSPGEKPRYDFNFKYNFVVTAAGDNMFDYGSTYIPPDLARDFETVRTKFCKRHPSTIHCTPRPS